jgi:hypothetical protein
MDQTALPPNINHDAVWLARVAVALAISGLSKTHLYGAGRTGKIRLVKCGRSTLVDMVSLRSYVAALPAKSPTP